MALVDLDEPDALSAALDEFDLVVSTVPDVRLVAERMVPSRGGVLVPEDAFTIGELGPGLAESDIVVVDEP